MVGVQREETVHSFSKALALRCRAHRLELKDLQIPVHVHTQLSEPLVNLTQKRERPRHWEQMLQESKDESSGKRKGSWIIYGSSSQFGHHLLFPSVLFLGEWTAKAAEKDGKSK